MTTRRQNFSYVTNADAQAGGSQGSNPFDRLGDEILMEVFCHLKDPGAWSETCKRFRELSSQRYVRCQFFLSRYGKNEAIFAAIARPKLLGERAELVDLLVGCGAVFSRYLVQVLCNCYMQRGHIFVGDKWGRPGPGKLTFQAWTHIMNMASEKFGNVDVARGGDDGALFCRYSIEIDTGRISTSIYPASGSAVLAAAPQNQTVIARQKAIEEESEKRWNEMKELFETYKFLPFCERDPAVNELPKAIAREPRLLPLAKANGFSFENRHIDFVVRKLFTDSEQIGDPAERTRKIVDVVQECQGMNVGLYISVDVACEVLNDPEHNRTAYEALRQMDGNGSLNFKLRRVPPNPLRDVVRGIFLASPTRRIMYDARIFQKLWQDFRPIDDLRIKQIIAFTVFHLGSACAEESDPLSRSESSSVIEKSLSLLKNSLHAPSSGNGSNKWVRRMANPATGDCEEGPRRKALTLSELRRSMTRLEVEMSVDVAVGVLCNRFMFNPSKFIAYIAQYHGQMLEQVIQDAATKMVASPSKGGTLLCLVRKYPHLRAVVEKAILAFRIDISKLQLDETYRVDSQEARSSFCTPVAFDYEHFDDGIVTRWTEPSFDPRIDFTTGIYEGDPVVPVGCHPSRTLASTPASTSVARKPSGRSGRRSLQRANSDMSDRKEAITKAESLVDSRWGHITMATLAEGLQQGLRESSRRYDQFGTQPSWLWQPSGASDWGSKTRKEFPRCTIPTAIALLDILDPRSPAVQVVLMHACINRSFKVLRSLLTGGVLLTMQVFRAFAALGHIPPNVLFEAVMFVPFFNDERDFKSKKTPKVEAGTRTLTAGEKGRRANKGKGKGKEVGPSTPLPPASDAPAGGKSLRPRRSVGRKSYAEGSTSVVRSRKAIKDEETEEVEVDMEVDLEGSEESAEEDDDVADEDWSLKGSNKKGTGKGKGKGKAKAKVTATEESEAKKMPKHAKMWVEGLAALVKEEDKKLAEKKAALGVSRIYKTEFHKAVAAKLHHWRPFASNWDEASAAQIYPPQPKDDLKLLTGGFSVEDWKAIQKNIREGTGVNAAEN